MGQERSGEQCAMDGDEILAGIKKWVLSETPTTDAAAVNRLVDKVETAAREFDGRVDRIPGRDEFGDILIVRSPWGGDDPGILVLSHLDTVHPVGTLENHNPFRQEGDRVYGPGIFDMKAGAYIALYAFEHLIRTGQESPLPLTYLYVPDEEIGSPTSRALIERLAQRNKYVLVTEPAHGGRCCTARKGVLHARIRTIGKPAHAGSRHEDGRSAVRELAHHIIDLENLTDYQQGTTVNVGLVSGGSFINVVPAEAQATICIRAREAKALDALKQHVLSLRPITPDVKLDISAEINRPVFPRLEGTVMLFEHARRVCRDVGFELEERYSGGGSDGNFTAALGVPTLDGLGADGHGHHTFDEYILYSSLEPRARMWLRLLQTLE